MRKLTATVVRDGLEFKIEWSLPVSLPIEQIITDHINLYLVTNPVNSTELAHVSTIINGVIDHMIDRGEIQESLRGPVAFFLAPVRARRGAW